MGRDEDEGLGGVSADASTTGPRIALARVSGVSNERNSRRCRCPLVVVPVSRRARGRVRG
jgi:hypothetical protein